MLSDEDLILRLEAWTEHDFHADRQLADEILIADGWKCEPDDAFEGGVRWYWGTNPQYSSSERTRPHPINDLNAAVGLVPRGYRFMLDKRPFAETRKDGQSYRAHVWSGDHPSFEDTISWAPEPAVALCTAVFKARRASRVKRPEAVAGRSLLKPAVTLPPSERPIDGLTADELISARIFGDDLEHWRIRVGALHREIEAFREANRLLSEAMHDMRASLIEIASVGDGWGARNKQSGTTGEGHARCLNIADEALGIGFEDLPSVGSDADKFWSDFKAESAARDSGNG